MFSYANIDNIFASSILSSLNKISPVTRDIPVFIANDINNILDATQAVNILDIYFPFGVIKWLTYFIDKFSNRIENWSKNKLVDDMYDTYILKHLQSIDLPRGVYLASTTNYEGHASTCLCMIAISGLDQQYFPSNILIADIVGDAHLDLQPVAPGRILYKHHKNNKGHTLRIIKINSFIGDIIN